MNDAVSIATILQLAEHVGFIASTVVAEVVTALIVQMVAWTRGRDGDREGDEAATPPADDDSPWTASW